MYSLPPVHPASCTPHLLYSLPPFLVYSPPSCTPSLYPSLPPLSLPVLRPPSLLCSLPPSLTPSCTPSLLYSLRPSLPLGRNLPRNRAPSDFWHYFGQLPRPGVAAAVRPAPRGWLGLGTRLLKTRGTALNIRTHTYFSFRGRAIPQTKVLSEPVKTRYRATSDIEIFDLGEQKSLTQKSKLTFNYEWSSYM